MNDSQMDEVRNEIEKRMAEEVERRVEKGVTTGVTILIQVAIAIQIGRRADCLPPPFRTAGFKEQPILGIHPAVSIKIPSQWFRSALTKRQSG